MSNHSFYKKSHSPERFHVSKKHGDYSVVETETGRVLGCFYAIEDGWQGYGAIGVYNTFGDIVEAILRGV